MSDGRDDDLYADRTYRPGPPPELREPPRRRSRALGLFVATFALAAFAGVVWYAYDQGLRRGTESTAPLIKADPRPIKVRPEQPGGLQVPNQDKLVYEAMRPGDNGSQRVERLLPPPEKPVAPPPPPPPPPQLPPASTGTTVPIPDPVPSLPPAAESPAQTEQPQVAPNRQADANIPPARVVTPAPTPTIPTPADNPPRAAAEAPPPPPTTPPPAPPVNAAPAAQAPATPSQPAPAQTAATNRPPEPKPAPAAPAAGGFRIQLGALRDEASAEAEWARLKKRYPEQLGALDRRIQRIDLGSGKGVFYRIQSSGVSESAAGDICAGLKAKGQACMVVRP